MATGILNDRMIGDLVDRGAIRPGRALADGQVQPASLDLQAGRGGLPRARLVSARPGRGSGGEAHAAIRCTEIDLSAGAVLETGCVYIVPLLETLALPKGVAAAANPKSSTGRLDVFTRVITDGARQFEPRAGGLRGDRSTSRSRLARSPSSRAPARGSRRCAFARARRSCRRWSCSCCTSARGWSRRTAPSITERGIAMSVALDGAQGDRAPGRGRSSATARSGTPPWSTSTGRAPTRCSTTGSRLRARGRPELVLDPDQFYILVSREAIHVPPTHAAEMGAVRPARRRVPRALRRLLRSRLRPRRGRRHRRARRAPRCARTRCRSSWSTGRRWDAWSTSA